MAADFVLNGCINASWRALVLGLMLLFCSPSKAHMVPLETAEEAAPSSCRLALDSPNQDHTDKTEQGSCRPAEPKSELALPEADLKSVSTSAADLGEVPFDHRLWPSNPQVQLAEPNPIEASPKSFEFSFAQPDVPLKSELFSPQAIPSNTIAQSAPADPDSEIEETEIEGVDPELGIIRIRTAIEDPELGIIRIREQPLIPEVAAQQSAPIAYLTGRISLLDSDNIFLALDQVQGLVGDQLIRPGVSLGLYPALGRETYLLAVADINFQRYFNVGTANYDEVRLRLGIRQGLTPRSYAQLSWSHQGLFRPGIQDRFFANDSFELLLARRDPLTSDIAINTYYQLQLNLSNPQSFDRLIQFAGIYASYQITPQLQAGLNYQLTLADYTAFERFDTYQQIIGQMIYQITPEVRVSLFGGFSFGRSSLPNVRFEDAILGINLEGTVPLF